MIRFISGRLAFSAFCACSLLLNVSLIEAQGSSDVSSLRPGGDAKWKDLDAAGVVSLRRASECFALGASKEKCSQTEYMKEAAKAYESMEALLVPRAKDPAKLLTVAKGLLKSGKTLEAITFLRSHDIQDDPNLLHLLGDVLYSIGDYRSAGAVYRRWIELGCKGYFLDPDDPALWVVRIGASSCSSLPVALRSKLDYVEQRMPDEDESLKLPPAEVPAVRSTAR